MATSMPLCKELARASPKDLDTEAATALESTRLRVWVWVGARRVGKSPCPYGGVCSPVMARRESAVFALKPTRAGASRGDSTWTTSSARR